MSTTEQVVDKAAKKDIKQYKMAPVVEKVCDNRSLLGEGPFWDETKQVLYFVDITGQALQKFDPNTNTFSRVELKGRPSVVIPIENSSDQLLIAEEKNLELVRWNEVENKLVYVETLYKNIDDGKNTRWNDGKCDPSGRLWIGTMDLDRTVGERLPKERRQGTFNSLSSDKKLTKHLDNIGISNGIAVDSKVGKFYYTDSDSPELGVFDFDTEKGTIGNKKVLFNFRQVDIAGGPDGMTIDTDGNIWVAAIGGGKILKIDPTKPNTLLESIDLPANEPTSLAWGGPDLNELYVTTARIEFPNVQFTLGPDDGCLYRIKGLGVKGAPATKFKL